MFKTISSITGKMSAIDRYSQTRLINPESVLEHTGWVCMTCLFIGKKLTQNGEHIDMACLLSKAVIHDVEEVVIGDIASPTKYFSTVMTREVERMGTQAVNDILFPLELVGIADLWKESKKGKEGYIVALADKLAVAYKVHQEVAQFGNQTIKGHVVGLIPALESLRQLNKDRLIIVKQDIINEIIDEAIQTCQTLI